MLAVTSLQTNSQEYITLQPLNVGRNPRNEMMNNKIENGFTTVTLRKTMFEYWEPSEASHFASGTYGQHREHGCAAQSRRESDCCAGPIQMGHCVGWSMRTFSKSTLLIVPHSSLDASHSLNLR